jgi:hypothetical protein
VRSCMTYDDSIIKITAESRKSGGIILSLLL